MNSVMVPTYQVLLSITATHVLGDGEIEATSEAVLEGLTREAAFVALGPVVTADESNGEIEVECSVAAERPEDLHKTVGRLSEIMLGAANSYEYHGSTTEKLSEFALA